MLFADDKNIFISHTDPAQLKKRAEEIINKLNNWLKCNQLTLSIEKNKF